MAKTAIQAYFLKFSDWVKEEVDEIKIKSLDACLQLIKIMCIIVNEKKEDFMKENCVCEHHIKGRATLANRNMYIQQQT